jgi:aryl-alcohol dehydrogenase-like predicted oxidoreductase
MRYRPLGNSGLVVSVVGLGCNNIGRDVDADGAKALVTAALDCGVTLLDTADVYPRPVGLSEEILGRALAGRRHEIVLATKFGSAMDNTNGPDWGARGSRRYIRRAVEASLRRLNTDWIDLYQYHAPDRVTPIEETIAALGELVTEGKVRYLGSSNFAGWQVVQADFLARTAGSARFISAQNGYSLLDPRPEAELVPACLAYDVGLLPFYPLANGLLTGKHQRDSPPPPHSRIAERMPELHRDADWPLIERLTAFGAEHDRSLLEVAIGGLAAQPAVTSVIAGARTPQQLRANAAAGNWVLTADDLAGLAQARTASEH